MPAKKAPKSASKRKSKIVKEALPSPADLKDGKHDYYIGNWSYYQSVEDISHVSRALLAAHTREDRQVGTLPRVNVLLLPPTAAEAAEQSSQEAPQGSDPVYIEAADNMHIEGVSRRTVVESEALIKDWKRNPPVTEEAAEDTAAAEAGVESADTAVAAATDNGETAGDVEAAVPAESAPVYEPNEIDKLEAIPVTCGADFSARHARVAGQVSLEGVLPQLVVKPNMPNPPADEAALLEAITASRKVSAVKEKKAKKGKKAPKLTPEELEELEQRKAEAEAEFQRLTEEAVQKAKEQEDYLMTFAHPDKWANVVVQNVTFTGPVVVRRAHVTFQNCVFAATSRDAAQLTVSQYCRVSCTKCTFDAPVVAGAYALPTAQLEVSKCLFSGVPQVPLVLAQRESAAQESAHSQGGPSPARADDDEEDGVPSGDEEGQGAGGTGPTADNALLPAAVVATSAAAEKERATSVGIHSDAARVQVLHCEFVFLGTAVVLRGRFQSAARMPAIKGLPKSSATLTVEGNLFHYLYSTAILVEDTARDVLIQRNHTADCAYYALDCHGGAKGVSVYRNNFSTNSAVRIRKGCQPQFLENTLDSIPIDDNQHSNPALESVY